MGEEQVVNNAEEQVEANEEKDFAEAYNETIGADVMPVPEEEPSESEATTTDEGETSAKNDRESTEESTADDETTGEEETAGEEEAAGDPEKEKEEPEVDIKALLEENNRLRERTLRWAGRVKAADKRLQEFVSQSNSIAVPDILNEQGSLNEEFAELKAEMPELSAIEDAFQAQQETLKRQNEQFGHLSQAVQILQHQNETLATQAELNTQFPGYLSALAKKEEEFTKWAIERLPREVQEVLPSTNDTDLLSTVLSAFDNEVGLYEKEQTGQVSTEQAEQERKKREANLAATLGVGSRPGSVVASPPKEENLDKLFKEVYEKTLKE